MIDVGVIKNAHALVVGCGALGNEVLKNLVLMGIRHIVIVDFDYVEQGNLTRSILFRKADVGRRKVDVAKETLLGINPDLDIKTIFGDVAYDIGLGLIRRMDIIIGCVDSRWARYCIQRLCLRAGKTWVDGGILDLTGTVKVFRPGETCYACSLSTDALKDLQRRMPCSGVIHRREAAGHAPTTPIIASIIGAVQAQEAIKVLCERHVSGGVSGNTNLVSGATRDSRMLSYDGDSLTVRTPIFEAWDEDCPLHGEWHDTATTKIVTIDLDETVLLSNHTHSLCGKTGEEASIPATIILNEPFVDYIVSRKNNERFTVMMPAHKVEDFFVKEPRLRGQLMSDFYQHEYREIDSSFPYPTLTFRELGIPEEEQLRVHYLGL